MQRRDWRVCGYGLFAAFFFSATFILNRSMSFGGGHWYWTASLRFGYMALILIPILIWQMRSKFLYEVLSNARKHWLFWMTAGSVGYGFFYLPLCYSAYFAPAWVVASTWQLTIVASLFVLFFIFGRDIPFPALVFASGISMGGFFVNYDHAGAVSASQALQGSLPVLLAAFAYPIGNEMVKRAKSGGYGWIPEIQGELIDRSFGQVFLLTLGSVPFWIISGIIVNSVVGVEAPAGGQLFQTFLVALFSGVIATSIFYVARQRVAKDGYQTALADATQSGEAVFSLFGDIFFLGAAWPSFTGWSGLVLIVTFIWMYSTWEQTAKQPV